MLGTYRDCMGGMTKHDWLVSKYTTFISHLAALNAWTIHTFVNKGNRDVMNLLDSKRYNCVEYLELRTRKPSSGEKS